MSASAAVREQFPELGEPACHVLEQFGLMHVRPAEPCEVCGTLVALVCTWDAAAQRGARRWDDERTWRPHKCPGRVSR